MNKKEKILYLKDKINKMYGSKEKLKEVLNQRTFDKTILEKLEKSNG